jgi:hypothetical protein
VSFQKSQQVVNTSTQAPEQTHIKAFNTSFSHRISPFKNGFAVYTAKKDIGKRNGRKKRTTNN